MCVAPVKQGDEQPIHTVTVPTFELLATEVTVSEYRACVVMGGCSKPGSGYSCNWDIPGYEEHPVNCVDWYQAVAFCSWAGGRLPSESEWEYAARGRGQAILYPWGNEEATCDYAVMGDAPHTRGCTMNSTWPVCSKVAGNTDQGLCDMSGNVWEWVQDWYHADYNGAPVDGSAWEYPRAIYRGIRGGCFDSGEFLVRAAIRHHHAPDFHNAPLGFRCAR